jgi:hypothetical protein
VVFRLRNEHNPDYTLSITSDTWYGVLDLAGEYGWNPMGTILPGQWDELEVALAGYFLEKPFYWQYHGSGNGNGNGNGSKNGSGSAKFAPDSEDRRMVSFQDALNLADALDQAFLEYEPLRVPASFYLFEPRQKVWSLRPSIGAIAELVNFCRSGGFWIERQLV